MLCLSSSAMDGNIKDESVMTSESSDGDDYMAMSLEERYVFESERHKEKRGSDQFKYRSWPKEDVLKLLDIWSEPEIQKKLQIQSKHVYPEITSRAYGIGLYYTNCQIKTKIRRLRQKYLQAKQHRESDIYNYLGGIDPDIYKVMDNVISARNSMSAAHVNSVQENDVDTTFENDVDAGFETVKDDMTSGSSDDSQTSDDELCASESGRQNAKKKRNKYVNWDKSDVLKLLGICSEPAITKQLQSNFRNVYKIITSKANADGMRYSFSQIKTKFRRLRQKYSETKKHGQNGTFVLDSDVYQIMDHILGSKMSDSVTTSNLDSESVCAAPTKVVDAEIVAVNEDDALVSSDDSYHSENPERDTPTTSGTKKRSKYTSWKKDDVMTLLGIWSAADIRAKVLTNNDNTHSYETIAERACEAGLTQTLDQIKSKIRKLCYKYNKARSQSGVAVERLMDQDIYRVLDEVLCQNSDYESLLCSDVEQPPAVLSNEYDTVNSLGQDELSMELSSPAIVKEEFCPTSSKCSKEKKGRGVYTSWPRGHVLKLLDIFSEMDIQRQLRTNSKTVYAEVTKKAEDVGVYYSRFQIKAKYRRLRQYYAQVNKQIQSGVSIDSIVGFDLRIYNMLDGLLGSGAGVKMATSLDSSTEPTDSVMISEHDSDAEIDIAANDLANDFGDMEETVEGEPFVPTIPNSTKKQKKYTSWSRVDTLKLLGIWQHPDIQSKFRADPKTVYLAITAKAREVGLTQSRKQLSSKIRKLREYYYAVKECRKNGSHDVHMDPDMFRIIDRVLCGRKFNKSSVHNSAMVKRAAAMSPESRTEVDTATNDLANDFSDCDNQDPVEGQPCASIPPSSAKKKQYTSWSRVDTLKLLEIWRHPDIQSKFRANSKTVYLVITAKAREVGLTQSREQLSSKIRKLREYYYAVTECRKKGSHDVSMDPDMFRIMDSVLCGRKFNSSPIHNSTVVKHASVICHESHTEIDPAANDFADDSSGCVNQNTVEGEHFASIPPNTTNPTGVLFSKKKLYSNWSRVDTLKLLDIWRRPDIQSKFGANTKTVYREITAKAREVGLKRSTAQLTSKIHKLRQNYYAVKYCRKTGSNDVNMDPEMFKIMDRVLHEKKLNSSIDNTSVTNKVSAISSEFSSAQQSQPVVAQESAQIYPIIKSDLSEMTTIVATTDVWTCLTCPALFTEKSYLDEHKENAHNFSCGICGSDRFSFPNKQTFVTHFVLNHGASARTEPVLWDLQNSNDCQQANDSSDPQPLSCEAEDSMTDLSVKCEIESVHDTDQSAVLEEECDVFEKAPVESSALDHVAQGNVLIDEQTLMKKIQYKENKLVKSVVCSVCKLEFSEMADLEQHCEKERHQSGRKDNLKKRARSAGILNCPVCKATFTNAKGMFIHVKVHHKGNTDLERRTCNSCFIVFAKPKHLRIHRLSVHAFTEHKPKSALSVYDRIKQKAQEKSQQIWKERGCTECNKVFQFRRTLVGHMNLVHNIQIPLESQISDLGAREVAERAIICCEVCGIEIQTRNMKKHLETHNQSRTSDHKCPYQNCEKTYGRFSDLNVHIKASHKDGQICPHCGEKFRGGGNLHRHVESVHGPPDRKFKCKLCDREFTAEFKLRRHHTFLHLRKSKTWVCQYCGKTFNMKRQYVDHINLHTKENTFTCELCSKEFSQATQLKNHRRSFHGLYKTPKVMLK